MPGYANHEISSAVTNSVAPQHVLISQQNKELEAAEERKRKAKQLEMQRKDAARGSRGMPRTPVYPTYTPPSRPSATDSYDSYEAEKNKVF